MKVLDRVGGNSGVGGIAGRSVPVAVETKKEVPVIVESDFDREVRERKENAKAWPEEAVVRVNQICGNKTQVLVILEDGRVAPCWNGGYKLYRMERLKVKAEWRGGEDVIYEVVERLADEEINARKLAPGGMTVEPVGFEGQVMPRPVVAAETPVTGTPEVKLGSDGKPMRIAEMTYQEVLAEAEKFPKIYFTPPAAPDGL